MVTNSPTGVGCRRYRLRHRRHCRCHESFETFKCKICISWNMLILFILWVANGKPNSMGFFPCFCHSRKQNSSAADVHWCDGGKMQITFIHILANIVCMSANAISAQCVYFALTLQSTKNATTCECTISKWEKWAMHCVACTTDKWAP